MNVTTKLSGPEFARLKRAWGHRVVKRAPNTSTDFIYQDMTTETAYLEATSQTIRAKASRPTRSNMMHAESTLNKQVFNTKKK